MALTADGFTVRGGSKRRDLRLREGHGIPGGAVKCVEIRRNTEGEGRVLAGD